MNEEEKKAIARVERLYKFSQDVNHTAIVLTEDTRCLGIVLNLLQQEKEKNKKLEEELKSCFKDDYIKRHELNTVIHLMADDMMNGFILSFKNSIELKDYYFKKARGEEDEKTK